MSSPQMKIKKKNIHLTHKVLGLICVTGLIFSAITGWILNHPNILKSNTIKTVVYSNKTFYRLEADGIIQKTETSETLLPSDYPISTNDHLYAYKNGIAILHQSGIVRLYQDDLWDRITLPNGWPLSLQLGEKKWVYTTTTAVWESENEGQHWNVLIGPYPESISNKMRRLHSGHYFGKIGVFWINTTALLILVLSLTGVWMARTKKRQKNHDGAKAGPIN